MSLDVLFRAPSVGMVAAGSAVRPGPRVTAGATAANKGFHHAAREP